MRRSKHSLSHYKLLTGDMGQLIPVGCFEVLPGDSVQQATSLLLRVSPLVAPVMHPVSVRVHHFFVPNRLVCEDWEDFITGGPDGMDASDLPTINAGGSGFAAGGLLDYFGVPPGVANLEVSALPVRAYNLVFNEYYRDQDLVTERPVPVAGGVDATSPVTVASVAWEKDYFTSARPWPQKGPDITLPLGDQAIVRTNASDLITGNADAVRFTTTSGGKPGGNVAVGMAQTTGALYNSGAAGPAQNAGIYPSNLYADLSTATGVDVNDVRRAFALQRYQEARARYGSRYTEYLRYLGVNPSDARLQRPEYLGGGKQTISFTEVLQTGPDSADDGVASMKGHGIAALRSRRYRRFFNEHGVVVSLLSVRPRTMYTNGLHRMWTRATKEDYWQKELEHIGQQEVLNKEVYAAGAAPDDVFGYQDRYAEYRHLPSTVSGEFRTTLNHWHLARIFAAAPALNSSFVQCDPADRIFQSTATHGLWIMANNSIQARRLVARNAGGKIL